MNEFIEKLIERLEECEKAPNVESPYNNGWKTACQVMKNAVNQLAEEYRDKSSIIDGLRAFLKEKFDYCAEQAEMNLEAECNSEIASYFRDRKELYLDRANIYGEVMRIVNQLAEEYNNDFCEWHKVKNGNAYKCNTHAEIHDSRVLDWCVCPYCGKKIKIAPYQPKGE